MSAAFKIKGTPVYRIEPSIEGVGRLPRMTTGVRDKRIAEQMEGMLQQLARTGYLDLVCQLRDGDVTLMEIWNAHLSPGREAALNALRIRKDDPLLSVAVEQRTAAVSDDRVKGGLAQLVKLAPEDARLSWLLEPTHITGIYEKALRTHAPNTVRRSLHRAVADLLTRHFKRSRMLAIMADVVVPHENDERKVMLTRDEIANLLNAADEEFRNAIGFALTSGVDQGPQRQLLVRDLDERTGILHVRDEKTPFRNRRFLLDADAQRYFLLASAGKDQDERVFPYTKDQLDKRWRAVRTAAGREDVRWKDLRGVFATYFLEAGGSPRELQLIMGHSTLAMTLRYVRQMAATSGSGVGRAMGLGKTRLRIEKGA